MTCSTYLSDSDKNRPIGNPTIVEWLAELRRLSGRDWQVIERPYEEKRLLRKPKTKYVYELLLGLGDGVEYQCINFYRDNDDWSINFYVSAELIVAYLVGACGATQNMRDLMEQNGRL